LRNDLIKASDLGFSYRAENGDVEVLQEIDLNIEKGSFLSIIGPSGCGKTSLLRLIAGLENPTVGEIDVKTQNSAYVFQQPALFPWADVRANVSKPLKLSKAQSIDAKTDEALTRVGLSDFDNKYPHQLSGGMQQRVAIARALVMQPELLLMDEPFGALDEMTRETMNLELHKLWVQMGMTICFVTHSIAEAVFLSTDILVLSSRPGKALKHFKNSLPAERTREIYDNSCFIELVSELRNCLK